VGNMSGSGSASGSVGDTAGSDGRRVDRVFWRCWSRCPLIVAGDKGGYRRKEESVSPAKGGM